MQLIGGWVRHGRRVAPEASRHELEAVGEQLLGRYREPHRHYHDEQHLGEVLAAVALLAEHAADLSAVVLAAWWHDAVYDVPATDNEQRSAALAMATLAGWHVDADRAAQIGSLIRMTATHAPDDGGPDAQVLSDADLAILASPPNRYASYLNGVRQEHADLPDERFAQGRAELLHGLLGRGRLYRTASAFERWERAARANLESELRTLEQRPDPRG